jgi:hypothetical protein
MLCLWKELIESTNVLLGSSSAPSFYSLWTLLLHSFVKISETGAQSWSSLYNMNHTSFSSITPPPVDQAVMLSFEDMNDKHVHRCLVSMSEEMLDRGWSLVLFMAKLRWHDMKVSDENDENAVDRHDDIDIGQGESGFINSKSVFYHWTLQPPWKSSNTSNANSFPLLNFTPPSSSSSLQSLSYEASTMVLPLLRASPLALLFDSQSSHSTNSASTASLSDQEMFGWWKDSKPPSVTPDDHVYCIVILDRLCALTMLGCLLWNDRSDDLSLISLYAAAIKVNASIFNMSLSKSPPPPPPSSSSMNSSYLHWDYLHESNNSNRLLFHAKNMQRSYDRHHHTCLKRSSGSSDVKNDKSTPQPYSLSCLKSLLLSMSQMVEVSCSHLNINQPRDGDKDSQEE